MTVFDNLTLGEVDEISATCLDGKSISDADPLKLAAGVMWLSRKKDDPSVTWDDFKYSVKMGEIRAFSEREMSTNGDEPNPTQAPAVS